MKIKSAALELELENGLMPGEEAGQEDGVFRFRSEEGNYEAEVSSVPFGKAALVRVKVSIGNHPFRDSMNLVCSNPVTIRLGFGKVPEKLCVQYQHRDWWSRPDWPVSLAEVPERTQCLFYQAGKKYGCIFPMAGDKMKTYLRPGTKKELGVTMTAYAAGVREFDEPCLMIAEADSVYRAAEIAVEAACRFKNIPAKKERKLPEMFEYFGWCSWDAFYTDISADKVLAKVKELKKKKVPARWILMDDGWLSVRDQKLTSFAPDQKKFPDGFAGMNETIKKDGQIRWVGVWHALAGYWGGVDQESPLASEYRENLYETRNGKLIPHYEANRGFGFYRSWYEYLRKQGIDFVKVDGQSALKNYYKNNVETAKAAKGTHQALDAAAELYMNGNIINCMGMAVENMLNRPVSAVSRNSDDFTPNEPESFPEHILQNAYNAIFHDNLYYCDWDMYWTNHKDAKKHAIVRAVSGGPIYVSDRIGDTVPEEISPLTYADGRILRMDRAGMPSPDCLFANPLDGVFKLTNICRGVGAVAAFHLGAADGERSTEISPSDVHDLPEANYGIYDVLKRNYEASGSWGSSVPVTISAGGYRLFLMIPEKGKVTPVGLLDKYICSHAVIGCTEAKEKTVIQVREGGTFGFAVNGMFTNIAADGKDLTHLVKEEDGFYSVELPEKDGMITVEVMH